MCWPWWQASACTCMCRVPTSVPENAGVRRRLRRDQDIPKGTTGDEASQAGLVTPQGAEGLGAAVGRHQPDDLMGKVAAAPISKRSSSSPRRASSRPTTAAAVASPPRSARRTWSRSRCTSTPSAASRTRSRRATRSTSDHGRRRQGWYHDELPPREREGARRRAVDHAADDAASATDSSAPPSPSGLLTFEVTPTTRCGSSRTTRATASSTWCCCRRRRARPALRAAPRPRGEQGTLILEMETYATVDGGLETAASFDVAVVEPDHRSACG